VTILVADYRDDFPNGISHGIGRLVRDSVGTVCNDYLSAASGEFDELWLKFMHPNLVFLCGLFCHLGIGRVELGPASRKHDQRTISKARSSPGCTAPAIAFELDRLVLNS
jgi:hypothetical protein